MSKRLDGIKGYKYKTSSWQGLGAFRFFFKKQKKGQLIVVENTYETRTERTSV